MPLGAARLALLAATTQVTVVAEVIRKKVGVFTRGVDIATADSKFGGASMFVNNNNSTDHVEIDDASNTQFRLGSTFTIEGWFKPQLSGDRFWCFKGVNTSGGFGLAVSSSLIRFRHAGTTDLTYTRSDSNWQHIAFVSDGTNKQIYYNGSLVATTTASLNITDTTNLSIGNELTNSSFGYYGYIDEVRISDTARYTTGFTPSTTPFVNDDNTLLLLHMNGTDGSTFFEDDNGWSSRSAVGVSAAGNAQIDTDQSKFGGASALFDGTGDYLTVQYLNSALGTGDDFTWECWFRITAFPTTIGDRFTLASSGANGYLQIEYEASGPDYDFSVRLGTNFYVRFNLADTSTSTWHHVAFVKSGSNYYCFQNGTQCSVAATSGTMSSTKGWASSSATDTIGRLPSNTDHDMDGHIDEVRLSNTARYTSGFTAPSAPFVNDSNTVYLLHMDGVDGSTVFRDDNGPGRSAVGVSAVGNAQIDTAQYKFGGSSALFDGTGDYLKGGLNAPDTYKWATHKDFTVECWIRINDLNSMSTTSGTIIPYLVGNNSPSSGANYWTFGPTYAGYLTLFYYTGTTRSISSTSGSHFSTGTWYHIAMVKESTTVTLYINGTDVGSGTIIGTPQYSDSLGLTFGQYNSNSISAAIDEFRISDIARYTSGFTPSTTPFANDPNTLLLLHMDGTDGDTDFRDDNGKGRSRSAVEVKAVNNAQIDTAQYKFGGASLLLDGTDDIVAIGDDGNSNYVLIPTTGEFTWEFYVRPVDTTFQLISSVYGAFGDTNPAGRFWIGINGNKFEFSVNGGGVITDASTATTGSWVHLAAVRDSSNEFRFYVDGTEVGTSFTSSVTLASGYVAIGGTGNAYGLDFEGHVDEYRISDVCRYTANFTPPTAPFVNDSNTLVLLHMDGTDASTVFIDDNGNERYPMPIQALADTQISTTASKFGGTSIKFVTSGSYAEVVASESPAFGSGEFTIEFWLYYTAIPTTLASMLWDQRPGSNGAYPLIWTEGNSKANINYFVSGTARIATGAVLSANTWHHVAITRDSSADHKCYVDGVKQGATWNSTTSYLAGRLRIGGNMNGTNIVPGYMDEIRASSVCRYTADFTPPSAPFQNDADTILLLHGHGSNTNTFLLDDNGTYKE